MKKIDLKFWLDVYDKISTEIEMNIEDGDYFRENFGRPYSDDIIQKLREADSNIRKLHYMNIFVRERILRYNREEQKTEK